MDRTDPTACSTAASAQYLQHFVAYWRRAKTLRRGCESCPRPDEALLSLAFRTPEPKSGRPPHRGLTWVTMRPALRPATSDQLAQVIVSTRCRALRPRAGRPSEA